MLRSGLYARVSTNDQQALAMQNRATRVCRPARLDPSLCWSVRLAPVQRSDKLVRSCPPGNRRRAGVPSESLGPVGNGLLAALQELEHLGVGFVSLTEALCRITPAGRAKAGLLFGELEREIL
jgi:hypothetical protein